MSELAFPAYHNDAVGPSVGGVVEPLIRHVLACVDASPFSHAVLAHAAAVGLAFGARLTVMRVLEPSAGMMPTDPVDWTLCHRDVEGALRERALHFGDLRAKAVVIDGPAAERICAWVRDNSVDLAVLGAGGDSDWPFAGLGGTARRGGRDAAFLGGIRTFRDRAAPPSTRLVLMIGAHRPPGLHR